MGMLQEKLKPLADENVKIIQCNSEPFLAQYAFLSSRGRAFGFLDLSRAVRLSTRSALGGLSIVR
jgi:hypothetical protein